MKFVIDWGLLVMFFVLSLYFSFCEVKATTNLSLYNKKNVIVYVKLTLKYLLLHFLSIIFPLIIIRILNLLAQELFDEWYLSAPTRILSALVGYAIIFVLILLFTSRSKKWIRIYYFVIAFLFSACSMILLIPD